jgi:hypothetical protein
MADVNDAELAELKQAHAMLKSLYADNAVGFKFRKLVKEKFPTASMPELEAVEQVERLETGLSKKVEEQMSGVSKKIDDFLAARAKEAEDNDVAAFEARVNKIVTDRGYTEEGTKKLLGLMKDRGIQNPEDAAVIFESTQPKPSAKPREYSSRMQFISPENKDDESFKRLMADPDAWMGEELMAAIAETNPEE